MKKMGLVTGMVVAGMIGLGTYTLVNKRTKSKADRLINSVLDKANDVTTNTFEKSL